MTTIAIRSAALGDFVASLPVLRFLRQTHGPLTLVASPRYAELGDLADRWLDPNGAEVLDLYAGRPRGEYDLGLAYTSIAGDALRACSVRRVLQGTPKPVGTHVYEHLWSPLAAAGFGPRPGDPRLTPDPEALTAVRARLAGARPVVIAPGSGGLVKRWPISSWAEVASRLSEPVLWVRGPQEADEAPWPGPTVSLDLRALVALAASCRAWLGPDAGPSHVAAAAGAPTGVVFVAGTAPDQWSPAGAAVFDGDVAPAEVADWVARL